MMKQLSKFQRGSSVQTQFGGLRFIACFRGFSTFFNTIHLFGITFKKSIIQSQYAATSVQNLALLTQKTNL